MEKNSYTVLIVDDEQIEREAIRMILETSHLPISFIYEANSGRKMLEMTASHSVDIIILDINMPGLSGLQALEMLRSEGRDTKVIISTAYDEFNFAVKALQSGAVDFLVKPVDDETLIESLRKSIERLDEEKAKEAKISRREALLFGEMWNSSLISLAIGPAITIATVLFAVQQSTRNTRMEIPNSPPLAPLILLLITLKIN